MSATEDIFLDVDLTVPEAAEQLAKALGFELRSEETGLFLVRHQESAHVSGKLSVNYLADPEPEAPDAIDRYPLLWSLHRKGVPNWPAQMRAAREVFDEVVRALRWPALLTHDAEVAVADWSADRGLREFPADTPTDSELLVS